MSNWSTSKPQMPQKERRTRKSHSKVRSGCITCKIRRKKCDEAKPFCMRCSSIGRICDGYQPSTHDVVVVPKAPPPFSSCVVKIDNRRSQPEKIVRKTHGETRSVQAAQYIPVTVHRAPSLVTFTSEIDYHCFDYFRFKTGPHFECYFESLMWRAPTLRAAFSHPIVLKVATAVGAVNQRFNHGISRKAFELCATADRLYRDAVKGFASFMRNDQLSPNFHEISMIVSMLFSLFQAFQGNYEESVLCMTSAMKSFWDRPFTITRSESLYIPCQMKSSRLIRFLRQLHARVELVFGSPPRIHRYKPGVPLPPVLTRFETQEDARDSIFTELEWILYLPVRFQQDEKQRREAQSLHMSRIFEWSVAIAGLVQSQGERTTHQKEVCRLVKAVRDATFFVLYTILFIEPETLDFLPFATSSDIDTEAVVNPGADVVTNPSALNLDTTPSTQAWPDETDRDLELILTELSALIETNPNLSTRFARLSLLADSLTDPKSPWYYTSHDYSADSGIGPPRQSHLLYESSAKTRHMVRCLLSGQCTATIDTDAILTETSTRESADIYALAERVSSFEEHAVLAAAQEDLIPRGTPPEWIDIRFFHEERRVLLRYCRPDGLGERSKGLIWVQQWLEF